MNHANEESISRRTALEHELAVRSADADLLTEYGALLFEPFHEDESSRAALESALALKPEEPRALFWLAKLALHRELDSRKARALLERALAADPSCAECLSLLISILREEHSQRGRCIELALKLVAVAPDWPRAHETRAEVAESDGRLDEARQEYLEALRLSEHFRNRNSPWSYFEEVVTGRQPTAGGLDRIRTALKRLASTTYSR